MVVCCLDMFIGVEGGIVGEEVLLSVFVFVCIEKGVDVENVFDVCYLFFWVVDC